MQASGVPQPDSDTQGTAWALYMKLEEQFGTENVFFDRCTLRSGMQWRQETRAHLHGGALLVLVGRSWMPSLVSHLQQHGEDYVAMEIEAGLRCRPEMTVIPVLVDDAEMPSQSDFRLRCASCPIVNGSSCGTRTCSLTLTA